MTNTVEADAAYRRAVLFVTTLGAFMAPLDGSIVSVALPKIASTFRMEYAGVIWIPIAYLLPLATLLLTFGRLSDIRGRKRFFISGFTLFTVASALCGLSQSGAELIVMRGVQGVGAAMIGATSAAIVTQVFPKEKLGRALGVNVLAVYIGLSVGPTLGGILVQTLGWRSIFYINVPIGIAVVYIAIKRLRESSPSRTRGGSFDFLGAVLFVSGLSLVILSLTLVGRATWTDPLILGPLVGGLSLLVVFLTVELRRGEGALLDLDMFRGSRLFAAANISAMLNYTAFFAVPYFLSFHLQTLKGFSPGAAGLVLISMPIPMAMLSPLSGWLSDRFGSRTFATMGMGLMCAGLLLLSQLNLTTPLAYLVVALFVMGVGMGLFSAPNTSSVMGSVKAQHLGVASGTISTMRSVGQSLSLAIMGAAAATVIPPSMLSGVFLGITGGGTVPAAEFLRGESSAFLTGAAIALFGALTSMVRGGKRFKR
jgi:EmrB/QacA subfamily drug resistance transporter